VSVCVCDPAAVLAQKTLCVCVCVREREREREKEKERACVCRRVCVYLYVSVFVCFDVSTTPLGHSTRPRCGNLPETVRVCVIEGEKWCVSVRRYVCKCVSVCMCVCDPAADLCQKSSKNLQFIEPQVTHICVSRTTEIACCSVLQFVEKQT